MDWTTEWFWAWLVGSGELGGGGGGGLGGTYLGVELELDQVAGVGLDVVGEEGDGAIWPADLDGVRDEAAGRACGR